MAEPERAPDPADKPPFDRDAWELARRVPHTVDGADVRLTTGELYALAGLASRELTQLEELLHHVTLVHPVDDQTFIAHVRAAVADLRSVREKLLSLCLPSQRVRSPN